MGCVRSSRRRATGGGRTGKSGDAPDQPPGLNPDKVDEGDDAQDAIDEQRRRTTPRRTLTRFDHFDDISPDVGELDESAFDDLMDDDADEALSLLAELTGATDVVLRELARRLAGRVVVDIARTGPTRGRGVGRIRAARLDQIPGDLDLDTSMEELLRARASGAPPDPDRLYVSRWEKPSTALCLLIDRSGSMGGERLAQAAVAAAACAWRAGDDHSVVAFSDRAIVIRSQTQHRTVDAVVDDVFTLRGFGPTDLALGLHTARDQLARSNAKRRITILLSDCRPTAGLDPEPVAATLDTLCILAPADDAADAEHFAAATGASLATLDGPSSIPAALAHVLDER